VEQSGCLILNGFDDFGMAMAGVGDTDAAGEIEICLSLSVV
jgi:hypothetical protein